MEPLLDATINDWIRRLEDFAKSGETFDMAPWAV
jgi:hypothetical protein